MDKVDMQVVEGRLVVEVRQYFGALDVKFFLNCILALIPHRLEER